MNLKCETIFSEIVYTSLFLLSVQTYRIVLL